MSEQDKSPSLDELLRAGEKHAREVLIGGKDEMCPIVHLVRSAGEQAVLGTPWRNDREKEHTLKMLAWLMREGGVIRYMVICEAWMRKATDAEAASYKPGEPLPIISPLAEHPDRVEIVIASARERGEKRFRVWETKRDKHGQCVDLVEMTDAADWEGPWADLLPLDA